MSKTKLSMCADGMPEAAVILRRFVRGRGQRYVAVLDGIMKANDVNDFAVRTTPSFPAVSCNLALVLCCCPSWLSVATVAAFNAAQLC
jgi:hypothetical protein